MELLEKPQEVKLLLCWAHESPIQMTPVLLNLIQLRDLGYVLYADKTTAGRIANLGMECRDFHPLDPTKLEQFDIVCVDMVNSETHQYVNLRRRWDKVTKIDKMKLLVSERYKSGGSLFVQLDTFNEFLEWVIRNPTVSKEEVHRFCSTYDEKLRQTLLRANEKAPTPIDLGTGGRARSDVLSEKRKYG